MNAPPLRKPSSLKTALAVTFFVLLLYASAHRTGATLPQLIRGTPEMGKLLVEMWPPDWSYLQQVLDPMLETIRMALLGTTIGAIAAVPVALLSARNVVHIPLLSGAMRFLLNLDRTVPDLLFARLFVSIFGIGPFAGMLALAFFSLGLVAKLLYESIETIDSGPMEAMTAVGANKLQWIHFAIVPQVMATFTAYVLYTFEVNVRAATVLGFVGAGGIGLILERSLDQLRYDRSSTIILFTLAIVLVIDYASTKARERLL